MTIIGDRVQRLSLANTRAFEEDDDSREGVAIKTNLDLTVSQIRWSFEADVFQGEGVVDLDLAGFFNEEEFIIGFIGRKETDAFQIQAEAIDGLHADGRMNASIVPVLNPKSELAVEDFQ